MTLEYEHAFWCGGIIGREPRESRRQLEQQRAELPLREPEQQRPVEREQQSRFSRRVPFLAQLAKGSSDLSYEVPLAGQSHGCAA